MPAACRRESHVVPLRNIALAKDEDARRLPAGVSRGFSTKHHYTKDEEARRLPAGFLNYCHEST